MYVHIYLTSEEFFIMRLTEKRRNVYLAAVTMTLCVSAKGSQDKNKGSLQ